ncbi:MAG: Lrp/AsnC family transcriptional regulator, partial [Candidatus Micrarchaeia archaeon]
MRNIPEAVNRTLSDLRLKNSGSLEIRIVKGNFYLYKVKNIWSRANKKQIKKGEYFGKIESDGTFKPVQRRKPRRMKTYAEEQNTVEPSQFRMHKSSLKYEQQILKALSMNGRITMKALGKLIGLSETAARHQVEALEKKYGIKYIPEIDITKLGYMPFFITVKFIGDMPPIENLKKELESIPLIQAAFLTKGSFDLMIYAVAKSNEDLLSNVLIKTRRNLSQYDSLWNIVIVYEDYGYIPLREQFVKALKEQVWHRSKQSERPKEGQLRERAFNVLK